MQCGLDSALREERPDHVQVSTDLSSEGPGLFRGFLPGLPVFLLVVFSHWLHSEPAPAQVAVWITACYHQGAVTPSNNSVILNSECAHFLLIIPVFAPLPVTSGLIIMPAP